MTRLASRVALVLAMLAISIQASAQQAAGARPTLVVLITIDQMRGDYLTRFGPQLTGGLGRLSRGGAWYTNAHHDHAITETAPGHATLLAGRFPRSTGIMANRIGVDDDAAPLIANGVGPGASPKRFVGTTLSDWLTASDSRSRTFSVSTKDRGAILPVGKSKSQVYWYSPDGRFVTSSYYRDALPPWVQAFNDRHFPQTFAGRSWDLLLPDSAYHEPDSVAVEGGGSGFVFPHIIPDDPVDAASIVRGTPFIDDITLAFALHGVQSLSLGAAQQTDLLAVSLSGTDFIGHRYGPDSREIHDQILRVDRALGVFLDSLYKLRDSTRVTVVLTGDHGAGTIPELAAATTKPTPARVTLYPLLPALRARLNKAGVDTNAFDIDQQVVLIDRKAFEKAKVNADSVVAAFAEEVRQLPGVARADRFKALLADTLTDPIARRWSHQFPPNSQIELVVTLTPYSLWRGNIASHGSPYDYDSNVPLVFYGAGVQPGKHAEFVRTVDLAPTLAEIAGVRPLEKLDGVVLRNALR
jgi:predicted AlkP superfamily pyrophosphatase or phosphodiesterase